MIFLRFHFMHTLLSMSVYRFITALIVRVYVNCCQLATVQLSVTLPRVSPTI